MSTDTPRRGPRVGELAVDVVTGRVGTLRAVMDYTDPTTRRTRKLAFLRPEGGGREWTTAPEHVRHPDPAEGER